jgi:hypothetical protein
MPPFRFYNAVCIACHAAGPRKWLTAAACHPQAVAVAMIVVALAASWVPAYRASRTDAMEALRHD